MKKVGKGREAGARAKFGGAKPAAAEKDGAKKGGARKNGAKKGGAKKRPTPSAEDRRRVVSELRAFAHPLRLRLFELFVEKPRTTMQVAEVLGEPPTRLYHHVNALQKAGLLRVRETRQVRGSVEKYLEAVVPRPLENTADVLRTSASARQSARAAAGAVLEQVRQDLNAEVGELKHASPGPMILRMILGATPARAATVCKRLLAFLKELKSECEAETGESTPSDVPRALGKDEERYALTIAFTRSWPRRREVEQE